MLTKIATSIRHCLSAVERNHSHKTLDHEDRVGLLSAAFATVLHLLPGHVATLAYAGGLHDVGKFGVPAAILDKPAMLDDAEWTVIRDHPRFGWEILQDIDDPAAIFAAEIALQHHERWDGTGYPAGLRGDAIMPEARIVALCDVYDTVRGIRPYKPAICHEEAVHIILHGDPSGRTYPSMFDPALLAILETDSTFLRIAFDAGPH